MSSKFLNSLGANYCNDFLNNAMFLHEGKSYIFQSTDGEYVSAYCYGDNTEKISRSAKTLPADIFTGWSSFAFPTLGYRQSHDGRFVGYVTRRASTRRGLNFQDAVVDPIEASYNVAEALGLSLDNYVNGNAKIPLVMCPTYTPLLEGLAKVKEGLTPMFAISHEFAVGPAGDIDYLEILFRKRRIGTIGEDGSITIESEAIRPSWEAVIKGNIKV